jgi:hypothetical protein
MRGVSWLGLWRGCSLGRETIDRAVDWNSHDAVLTIDPRVLVEMDIGIAVEPSPFGGNARSIFRRAGKRGLARAPGNIAETEMLEQRDDHKRSENRSRDDGRDVSNQPRMSVFDFVAARNGGGRIHPTTGATTGLTFTLAK